MVDSTLIELTVKRRALHAGNDSIPEWLFPTNVVVPWRIAASRVVSNGYPRSAIATVQVGQSLWEAKSAELKEKQSHESCQAE